MIELSICLLPHIHLTILMLCLTGLVTIKSLNHGSTSGHFQSTKVGRGKYNWKTKGKSIVSDVGKMAVSSTADGSCINELWHKAIN